MYDPSDYTLETLKDIAGKLKLPVSGNKTVLLGRIAESTQGRRMIAHQKSKRQKTSKDEIESNDEESSEDDEESDESESQSESEGDDEDDIHFMSFYERLNQTIGKDQAILKELGQKFAASPACTDIAELMCFADSQDIDDNTTFSFEDFAKRMKTKVGNDRALVNKLLKKYYPGGNVSIAQIQKLTNAKAVSELANIMCFEEE